MDTEKYLFKDINRRDAEFAEAIRFAQSGDGDWAKNSAFRKDMFLFVVVSRQTKNQFSAISVPLRCKIIICVNRRESAVNSIPILSWLKGCCDA